MKKIVIAMASVGLLAGSVVGAIPAQAGNLNSAGVSISWDESTFYELGNTGCSQFLFNWTNGGRGIYSIRIYILSRFGDKVGDARVITPREGASGVQSMQICFLTDGLGPYTLQLYVWQWPSSGIPDTQVTAPISFLSRTPAAQPTASADPAAAAETTTVAKPKSVKCISKKTFKSKTFKNKTKCPTGWVKI